MYSVKPGRGPSLVGAIFALVVGVPFMLFWIGMALTHGAPVFLVFFGIAGLAALGFTVFNGFYNATARNRVSQYDITTNAEEPDPFARAVAAPTSTSKAEQVAQNRFCPFCGVAIQRDFKFCPKCGKPQPESP